MGKNLQDMSNEELWALFPVELQEYDPEWPRIYAEEAAGIAAEIGEGISLHHIGSTAVPGLLAKPTVDMLLEISEKANIGEIIRSMEGLGYIPSPQPHKPAPHYMFMKGYTEKGFVPPVFHVHLRYCGPSDEILFRDYLREHAGAAAEYAALKRELLPRYRNDRDGYTEAKSAFVKGILAHCKK